MRPTYSKKVQLFLAILFGVCFLFAINSSAAPTATEYGTIINLSGKQRMLTQMMSKQVVLIALQFETDANVEKLALSSTLFARTLKGLRDGDTDLRLPATTNQEILTKLVKVDEIWLKFLPTVQEIIAGSSVTEEQLEEIVELNIPLLGEMNKCVKLYEKDAYESGIVSDSDLTVTINLAGKQRMLTQKMSKEFFLIAYGYEIDKNKSSLLRTYSLFNKTLKGLLDGNRSLGLPGEKGPSVRRQLKLVGRLWKPFMDVISDATSSKADAITQKQIQTVANTNLPLLQQMNKVVGMYERQANEQYL